MKTSRGLKIATIRGIELRLDGSLIFLMIYIVFVASARFPSVASEAGIDYSILKLSPLAWGFLFAIGLFISVVLHELGHCFVAQSMGSKVQSITLMMLGGVSSMERIPERPYFEFKLAVVGPLVSFALGGVLYLIRGATASPDLSLFAYWLGGANLTLGAFNLLPAFPLDGGRALRSALAVKRGPVRATQIAVRISKAFAIGLGVLGFFGFNVLLMLIAFFIYITAQSELFLLLSRGLLKGMTVGEAAIRVDPIKETASLSAAVAQMLKTKNVALPIDTVSGTPAVITLAIIKEVPREDWDAKLVHDVMAIAPKVLDVKEHVGQALPELLSVPGGVLPVRENGKLVGMLRYSHIADLLELKSLEEPAPLASERDEDIAA